MKTKSIINGKEREIKIIKKEDYFYVYDGKSRMATFSIRTGRMWGATDWYLFKLHPKFRELYYEAPKKPDTVGAIKSTLRALKGCIKIDTILHEAILILEARVKELEKGLLFLAMCYLVSLAGLIYVIWGLL